MDYKYYYFNDDLSRYGTRYIKKYIYVFTRANIPNIGDELYYLMCPFDLLLLIDKLAKLNELEEQYQLLPILDIMSKISLQEIIDIIIAKYGSKYYILIKNEFNNMYDPSQYASTGDTHDNNVGKININIKYMQKHYDLDAYFSDLIREYNTLFYNDTTTTTFRNEYPPCFIDGTNVAYDCAIFHLGADLYNDDNPLVNVNPVIFMQANKFKDFQQTMRNEGKQGIFSRFNPRSSRIQFIPYKYTDKYYTKILFVIIPGTNIFYSDGPRFPNETDDYILCLSALFFYYNTWEMVKPWLLSFDKFDWIWIDRYESRKDNLIYQFRENDKTRCQSLISSLCPRFIDSSAKIAKINIACKDPSRRSRRRAGGPLVANDPSRPRTGGGRSNKTKAKAKAKAKAKTKTKAKLSRYITKKTKNPKPQKTQKNKQTARHKIAKSQQGFVILAAPGVGKTWFVQNHKGWHDADELMSAVGIHTEEWHTKSHTKDEQQIHYQQCDAYTKKLRADGLKIVSSLFWEFVPDAIVIIDEDLHRQRVTQRPDLDWAKVQTIVKFLQTHAARHNIPVYSSLETASKGVGT